MSEKEDRRKFLKKAVVFGAIAGPSLAAGDLIGARRALASSPNPTVGADPTFSADGVQVPSLAADPASPVAGQVWFRNDLGQLRVQSNTSAYSVGSKPFVTVTPNGPADGGDYPATFTGLQDAVNGYGIIVVTKSCASIDFGSSKLVIPTGKNITIIVEGGKSTPITASPASATDYAVVSSTPATPAPEQYRLTLVDFYLSVTGGSGIDEAGMNVSYDHCYVIGDGSTTSTVGVNSRNEGSAAQSFSPFLHVGNFATNIILAKDHVTFGKLEISPMMDSSTAIQLGDGTNTYLPLDNAIQAVHLDSIGATITNVFKIIQNGSNFNYRPSLVIDFLTCELSTATNFIGGSFSTGSLIAAIVVNSASLNGTITHYIVSAVQSGAFQVLSHSSPNLDASYTTPSVPAGTGQSNLVTNTTGKNVLILQTGQSGTTLRPVAPDVGGYDITLASEQSAIILPVGYSIYYATTAPTSWTWLPY